MLPRSVALALLIALMGSCGSAAAADTDTDADEEVLRAAKLAVDGPSLLALFRKRTPDADSQARIKALIAQLGSDLFPEREEASEELAESGVSAVGMLRGAINHADLEIRRRARDALALIEQGDVSVDVLIAALRVLGRRKPPQLAETLLDFAPHAADADITEELCLALANREANPQLVRALTDKSPIKRAVAGAALGRGGNRKQLPAVRRLLRDPDLQVRRHVALGLLEARDRAAVPVLIELLAELRPVEAEHVESMLLQLAGDAAPPAQALRPDSTAQARKTELRDTWAEWWKQHGERLDMAKVELSPKWRGYTLAVCMTMGRAAGGRGRIVRASCILELDAQGHTRWQVKGLSYPVDAQVLNETRVLVTEYSPGQVTERNHNGDILRRINVPDFPLEARRLRNGNTLITTRNRVFEVDRNDKEVWTANSNRGDLIVSACPLRGGEVGICYRSGEFVRLDRNGKTLASFRAGRLFRPQGTHIQGLPNGHILVPQFYDNKVVEFDKDGREIWSVSYARPTCAQRLPNGRTLVAGYGNNVFVELDKKGREVKSQRCEVPLMAVRGR